MSATDEEIERYARAVLAGRRDVAAPGTLGERRVRVRFDDRTSRRVPASRTRGGELELGDEPRERRFTVERPTNVFTLRARP